MAVRVLAYECKYCGALKKTKHICEKHEIACFSNPDAKNCLLCQHMRAGESGRVCAVTGKRCSTATSALCNDFARRAGDE